MSDASATRDAGEAADRGGDGGARVGVALPLHPATPAARAARTDSENP
jgi:hypothetical protein